MYIKEDFSSSAVNHLLEPESLQILLFLYAVCHVVIVVSDWFIDLEVWKLMRTCFMLRQSLRTSNIFGEDRTPDTEGNKVSHLRKIFLSVLLVLCI